MSKIKIIINGKEYKALIRDRMTISQYERKLKRGSKTYTIKITQRIVQFYIPEDYEGDIYILLPLKKDQLKQIENDKYVIL